MPWVKLDDRFPDHRKIAELEEYAPLAGWLFVCGLAFCNRQLTDGRIPKGHVPLLASFDAWSHLGSDGEAITTQEIARKLVDVGLWEEHGGYYVVHDYAAYQPSREQVEHQRKMAAARADRFRKTHRNAVTPSVTPPVTNAIGNSVGSRASRVPYPGRRSVSESKRVIAARSGSRRRPDDEELTPERRRDAERLGVAPDQVEAEWDGQGDHEYKEPKSDWSATWRNWCRRAVAMRRNGAPSREAPRQKDPSLTIYDSIVKRPKETKA